MALFPRITTWVSNQVLTASALNGEFNNILNNTQASSLVGYSANVAQMQVQTTPGGVGSENLAGSISGELERIRYMLAYTLGTTFWYDQTGSTLGTGGIQTASLANNAVTAAKIANATITTTQIAAAAAIKKTQLEGVGAQVSATCGNFSYNNHLAMSDVTNLTVTITSHGRPVVLMLVHDGDAAHPGSLGSSSATVASIGGLYTLLETSTSTVIASNLFAYNEVLYGDTPPTPAGTNVTFFGATFGNTPPGVIAFHQPAAGTYTYKVQVKPLYASVTVYVQYLKLIAYEM